MEAVVVIETPSSVYMVESDLGGQISYWMFEVVDNFSSCTNFSSNRVF